MRMILGLYQGLLLQSVSAGMAIAKIVVIDILKILFS